MATEIQVPVRLKVLQESIAEFQKILNDLQPNTSNWKALNKIISQMVSESQKLSAQLSVPFSSEKQFTQANKTIDKLEETAARVSVVMQQLKFSDIKLTPGQENQFKAFETEIDKIRNAYKKLLDDTKQELLSNANNKTLIGNIDGKALEKDFIGIEKAIQAHTQKLESQIKERNEKLAELRSDRALGESATSLITEGMSAESIGEEVFNKYLRYTKNGTLTMNFGDKGVSKQALLNAIGEMYHLEPQELQKTIEESLGKSLQSINAEEINNVFKKMNKNGIFSGIIKRGKDSAGKMPIVNQGTEEIRAQLLEYQALAKQMEALSTSKNLSFASTDTDNKIQSINARMRELEITILNGARTNSTYTSSMQQLISQFPQLRGILESTNTQFLKMQQVQNTFNSMKNTIANFMGFYQVLNLTKKAIKEAANHIKELDAVMNKISIVTDMDTSDLWGQIDQYSAMAQRYGTTIKGAYEVSQIYYQQGLETNDVLTLTNETLKLAKVSGLDYASTTDYMTTAIRGFKMEMQDAATVVDVYSALAANTAVSQEELAVAMSKTASSMESVGSTFQETSAMIATMVAVTRESATNIGSAMKSIASRYGELTKDPSKLIDSEGETMAFNKVDAALQSVGISMKTAEGQFREFTDVIVELGEKWAELDSVQQRYIATQFAGNRQQSRFLALVSNIDLLKQNINVAENSEDVGTVQALKALDSLESKIEQVRVAYQQFYTTIGIEDVWKTLLDGTKNVVNTLNGMPKLFGKIPIAAINAIAQVVSLIKNVALSALAKVANQIGNILVQGTNNTLPQAQKAGESWVESVIQGAKGAMGKATSTGQLLGEYLNKGLLGSRTTSQFNTMQLLGWNERLGNGTNDVTRSQIGLEMKDAGYLSTAGFTAFNSSAESATTMLATFMQQAQLTSARTQTLSNSLMGLGSALSLVALSINTSTQGGKRASGVFMALSGVITGVAAAAKYADGGLKAIPWYAIASAIISVISGIKQFIDANNPAAALEEATNKAEELQNKAKELKADYNTLNNSIKKYNELEKSRYDSAEAAKEYQEQVDKLAEAYPELVQRYDENNQAVLNVNAMEEMLAKARDESAEATLRAAQAEAEKAKLAKINAEDKLHTENDDLKQFANKSEVDPMAPLFKRRNALSLEDIGGREIGYKNRAELQSYIKEMHDAGERGDAKAIIDNYDKLMQLADSFHIIFSEDLTKALEKSINSAKDVITQDNIIEASNRASVSAFMNSYYGNSKRESVFQDNEGLMTAATESLYTSVTDDRYDEFALRNRANDLFSDIDAIYATISESRRKEIDKILSNSAHYSGADFQTLIPELADNDWLITYFNNQIEYNKGQLTQKIDQLKTNRQSYDEGKLDESLTLLPAQIEQFESAIGDNITLDLRNLMTSGINQAQNLKKTGQNPQAFIDNFINFYTQASTLPAELRNNLISQFSANGFTNEGMIKTLDWIKENEAIQEKVNRGEVDFSSLEQMATSFIPNYSLTVASLEDSLTNNLDDIESVFSDLQSGIKGSKLGKTIAKAQELGLDLERSDFEEDSDKFVLRYEKFAELISRVDDIYTTALPEEGEFEKAYKDLTRLDHGDKLVDLHRVQDIQTILGSTYHDYFDVNDQLKAGVTDDQVYDALEKAYASTSADLEQYQAWLKIVEQYLTKTIDWKHGNYSTLEGKVDLTQIDESGAAIDTAYKRVQYLAAHPDAYTESELKEADVSNAVETYQKGMSSLITDLSKYGAKYLIGRGAAYDGVASETVSKIQQLAASGTNGVVNAIRKYGHQAGMTVTEINDAIIKALGSGKGTSVANMISGRKTTLNDINSFLSSYDPDRSIEDFLDEEQNLQGALAQVYDYNNLTGELKLKRNATLESVIAAYSEALGVDITQDADLLQQVTQQWITDLIAEDDKKDAGKQMSSVLSTLSSAKVGTRVDLSKSPELLSQLQQLGIDVSSGYYEVLSEYARDSILLQLESTDEEVNATLRPLQEAIQAKRSRNNARLSVSGTSFNQSDLDKYIDTFTDSTKYSASTKQWYAEEFLGYKWDEDLQRYIATEEAIAKLDENIAAAVQDHKSEDYIKELREKRGELAAHFRKDEKRDALSNLLSNYEDAADYIDAFYTQFGQGFSPEDLKAKGILTTKNGKQVIDVNKLQELIQEYDDVFEEITSQIVDEYINNAKKAGALIAQGTTSYSEIDTFRTEFTKLTGSTFDIYYDSLLEGFTYDAEYLRQYVTAAADKIGFDSDEGKKQWIEDQIDAITVDNLDFSKILDGTATSKERATLTRDLQNYVRTHLNKFNSADYLNSENFVEQQAEEILQLVSLGGQVAINAIKSTGKELTAEEISAVYRNQIEPLTSLAEQLSTLEKGSVVAKNQIEALRMAGFDVNADGVVQAVGDLVAAYRGIYWQMKNTGEATVAELNAVVGHLLDNRDGEQQAIDAISNASSMTYSQLADIYTNAGVQLTEEMVNQMQKEGTLKALGGNKVMISNFEKFAEGMGWEPDSEEYFSALKTYRSNMVEYNNKIGSEIKSEFEAVSNAKLGDKVNISRTIQQYGEKLFKDLDVNIEDGMLTISNTAQLPQIALRIATAAMQAGGMIEDELLNFIASIEDGIISGITSATDFNLNGTNSFASMQEFVNEYNQIFTDSQIDMSSFYYDTLFDTFKLDSSVLNKYIESQKAELKQYGLSDELIDTYIQDQTTEIARNAISIDALLGATDTETRNREATKLTDSIQTYLDITDEVIGTKAQNRIKEQIAYYEHLDDIATTQEEASAAYQKVEELQKQLLNLTTEQIVNILYQGGEAGVKWLKELKPDASSEEIASVYNAAINRLRTAEEELGKGVGETVSGLAADIIRTTSGFKYQEIGNGDIVIEAVGDMVEAYNILYNLMNANAQKTTADLNKLYADILTAEDQQNIDIINTLKNGTMSYSELGELLTKYNINFQEFMQDITNGVERDGFGNIRIVDWESFAKKIFNTDNLAEIANTDEYISAYKTYIDGIISLNKNVEQEIVNEIKQIENAKAGDWLNLGTFWTKITTSINEAIENVEPEWYNGNVKNLGHRVRVPGSIMAEHFSEYGNNPEDYSTIYGMPLASRSFAETVENMGMTFASLDEEGNAVTDLEDYVRHLFEIAEEQAHGSDNITSAMIKELDAQNRNLLLHIGVFENSLSISEVLEKEYAFTDELHNRDADASWFGHLQDRLQNFGATLEDGILKIGDNANLLGIADTLELMAEQSGLELGEGLEQVQDSVKTVLDSMREAITKGIQGGLTGEEQWNLIHLAENMGIGDIGFDYTKEGFKLTTESAMDLYYALNDISQLQGQLLFEDLKESLIETDSNFRTVQDTTAYIIELQEELNDLRSQEETPENQERIASLENELELAEKINRVRSIDSQDDSFNFMSSKIPDAQNNPLNYWKNWGQAFTAMKEAGKASGEAKNTMAYEDFYNIVSEIGKLAELSGKAVTLGDVTVNNCQSAADLITKAAGALKNVDGEMKIDLSKINIDFSSGLTELGDQIDEQVDALADEQIAMLDSVIAVLEIIVAMEALEDVDVDKDMEIDLGEIAFKIDGQDGVEYIAQFTDKMNKARTIIQQAFDSSEEGKNALEQVYVNTNKGSFTMKQILSATEGQLQEMGITADMYTQIFNNLYQMYNDQDYNDIKDTAQSVFDVFSKYDWGDLSITANSGKHILTINDKGVYQLNWAAADFDNYRNIFTDEITKKDEEIRQAVQDQFNEESKKNELSVTTNTKIKVLQREIVLIEEGPNKGKFKAGNQTYKTLEEATAASDLFGINAQGINVTGDGKNATATGTLKIGKFEMEVKSQQAGAVYVADGTHEYKTQQEAFNYLFNKETKSSGHENDKVDQNSIEYKTWKVKKGITLEPVFSINGAEGDISTNEQLRKAVQEYVAPNGGLEIGDQQSLTVNLGKGINVEIPRDKLQIDPKTRSATKESIEAYLKSLSGIDLSLKDTISSAITDAFTTLSSNTEGLNSTADALNNIASAAERLANVSWESVKKGLSDLQLPEGTTEEGETNQLQIKLEAIITNYVPGESDPNELVSSLTAIVNEYLSGEENPNDLVSALEAIISVYTDEDDPNDLVSALTAVISLFESDGDDPNKLVSALTAIVNLFTSDDDPNNLVNALTAIVQHYVPGAEDPNILVSALSAIVQTFKPGTDDPNNLVSALVAVVDSFKKGTGDPNKLVNALTAYITSFKESPEAEKPTLDDLIQFINEINTDGADTAIEDWRTAQESKALKIKVDTSIDGESEDIDQEDINNKIRDAVIEKEKDSGWDEGVAWDYSANQEWLIQEVLGWHKESTLAEKDAIRDYIQGLFDSGEITTVVPEININEEDAEDETIDLIGEVNEVEIPDEKIEVPVDISIDENETLDEGEALIEQFTKKVARGETIASSLPEDETERQKIMDALSYFTEEPLVIPLDVAVELDATTIKQLEDFINTFTDEDGNLALNGRKNKQQKTIQQLTAERGGYTTANGPQTKYGKGGGPGLKSPKVDDTDGTTKNSFKNVIEAAINTANQALTSTPLKSPELDDSVIDEAKPLGENISNAIAEGIQSGESNIINALGSIRTHIEELGDAANQIFANIKKILGSVQEHVSITGEITFETPFGILGTKSGYRGENGVVTLTVEGQEEIQKVKEEAAEPVSFTVTAVDSATSILKSIQDFKIEDKSFNITANNNSGTSNNKMGNGVVFSSPTPSATGNFAMAQGTLMGELGPELVVSNGRYFVAGQNGAEFVNLASDAIVFNHLQTEQLLKNGMSSTRGKALTNERNAVAFASGNVNGGPAMASASAALAALKELRAMCESLKAASVSDLATAGGGGGGGGGGEKVVDPKAWIDTVERWYNLTQKIAELEKQITHEQALRTKISSDFVKDGEAYYKSQRLSLQAIQEQLDTQEQLNLSRQDYWNARVEALKTSELGKIYTFDENGQLQFRHDTNLNGYSSGMEFLTNLYGFNELQKANYTNKEKYDILMQNGFEGYMKYANGVEIKPDSDNNGEITDEEWESYYEAATQAFRDRMDEYQQATQSLWDEIKEGEDQVLELENDRNELLKEIRDNQLAVEEEVLNAITESRQRQIDNLQEERDALEESTGKFIEGLSENLEKERDLYQNQENKRDLSRLKRQRDILARSGGSAAQISNLDSEIASKSQDMYFEMQQKQIDAIQEASDLELERLDNQINIMTETLEYQKKYGLLWEAVYDVMAGTQEEIANFIAGNTEDWWSKSPLGTAESANDTLFKAEQWTSYREDMKVVADASAEEARKERKNRDFNTYDKAMKAQYGNDYDKGGKYAGIFNQVYDETSDVTKARAAAQKAYLDDTEAERLARLQREQEQQRQAAQASSGGGSSSDSSGGSDKIIDGPKWVSDGAAGCHQEVTWKKQGKLKGGTQAHNKVKSRSDGTKTYYKCSRCGYDMGFTYEGGAEGLSKQSVNKALNNKKNGLATGGLVKARGVYELAEEGTEAVFNATQTKVLRDNILSNKPNSLISLLATYNQAYKDGMPAITNNAQSLVIESATVNMNVSQISNDYDARRAGEQALEEMMRIARKTGATNSIRR